jgi:polysaccharide deacetylase 2 family uncharacterized protein YibQ
VAAKRAEKGREAATAPRPEAKHAAPARPLAKPAKPAERATAPRAAIVIDDLGQRISHLEQLAALEIPLTIAVIPGLPATDATVREASRLGIEMILHQPMEPREEGGKDPGAAVLLATMTAEEVRGRLRESLAAVPGAVGVNNHMGSRFTEEPAGLAALMVELRERGLFWLDSRTTAATRGAEIAHGAGVPAIERDVFLDAKVSAAFTRSQLRRLLETARARGSAVGIGHPHPETIAALRELRGELLGSGVALVPLSALVPAAPGAGAALAAATRAETGGAGRAAATANP